MANHNRNSTGHPGGVNNSINIVTQTRRSLLRKACNTRIDTRSTQRHLITNLNTPVRTFTEDLKNTYREQTRRRHVNTRHRYLSRTTKVARATINGRLRVTSTQFIRMVTTNLNSVNSNYNRQHIRSGHITINKCHATARTSGRTDNSHTRRVRHDHMINHTTGGSKSVRIVSRFLGIRKLVILKSVLHQRRNTAGSGRVSANLGRNKVVVLHALQERHTNCNSTNVAGLVRAFSSRFQLSQLDMGLLSTFNNLIHERLHSFIRRQLKVIVTNPRSF